LNVSCRSTCLLGALCLHLIMSYLWHQFLATLVCMHVSVLWRLANEGVECVMAQGLLVWKYMASEIISKSRPQTECTAAGESGWMIQGDPWASQGG